jgi:general secretion pathway protein G
MLGVALPRIRSRIELMSSEQEPSRVGLQLAACLVTAVVISGTSYYCAWLNFGNFWGFRPRADSTRHSMGRIRGAIARYREQKGHLPAELTDLGEPEVVQVPTDESGAPVDDWGRPFHYEVGGDSYDLYSLGRDGVPGGRSEDADLHEGKYDLANERLTLWEFTTCKEAGPIRMTCLLAAVFALPLPLTRSQAERVPLTLPGILAKSIGTAVFAVLTALVISFLHLPTGH